MRLSPTQCAASSWLAVLLYCGAARAEEECAAAYEGSQVARSEGRLRAAQRELRSCTRASCPEFVRTDCARWLGEVESALPSVVLVAKSGGAEVEDVTVAFDDEQLLARLDGKAVPVDPGRHVLTFRRGAQPPVSLVVVIREGEKNRPISVELAAPVPAAPPPPPAADTAPRAGAGVLPHVLLGVGALGVAGFATFGLLGMSDRNELEESCAPRCDDARVDAIGTKYLVADVSLTVGVLALAASGYLFWSSRDQTSSPAARSTAAVSGGVHLSPRGGGGVARWSF